MRPSLLPRPPPTHGIRNVTVEVGGEDVEDKSRGAVWKKEGERRDQSRKGSDASSFEIENLQHSRPHSTPAMLNPAFPQKSVQSLKVICRRRRLEKVSESRRKDRKKRTHDVGRESSSGESPSGKLAVAEQSGRESVVESDGSGGGKSGSRRSSGRRRGGGRRG